MHQEGERRAQTGIIVESLRLLVTLLLVVYILFIVYLYVVLLKSPTKEKEEHWNNIYELTNGQ